MLPAEDEYDFDHEHRMVWHCVIKFVELLAPDSGFVKDDRVHIRLQIKTQVGLVLLNEMSCPHCRTVPVTHQTLLQSKASVHSCRWPSQLVLLMQVCKPQS